MKLGIELNWIEVNKQIFLETWKKLKNIFEVYNRHCIILLYDVIAGIEWWDRAPGATWANGPSKFWNLKYLKFMKIV